VRFKENHSTAFTAQVKTKAKASVLKGKILIVEGKYTDYKNNPDVLYVERNVRYHALGFRSQKVASGAWGVEKIHAPDLWAHGHKGKGIRVAVIDTGVDAAHPELQGKVETGFNALDGSANSMDDMGHGTHCSGTIAGNTVGIATEASIVPVKFLGADGSGTLEGAIKAIDWAAKQNVQIMSASWGGPDDSQALKDSIEAAISQGILFVAAAGNDGADNDKTASFPANYPNVISVAATDSKDTLASFSNYGATLVLLGAPGVDIYSSTPGGSFDTWSGTSMAAPHVSGALAILLESGCKKGAACLQANNRKIAALKDKSVTGGRLELK
jgi:subtilisin family serine protease